MSNFLKTACDFLEKEQQNKGVYYTPKKVKKIIISDLIIINPPYNGIIHRANTQAS